MAILSLETSRLDGYGWLLQVEECLTSPNVLVPLLELYQSNVRQLADLSDMVSEPLSDIERRILIALITIDVHNRWARSLAPPSLSRISSQHQSCLQSADLAATIPYISDSRSSSI